jgi:hypothetical protein
VLDPNFITYSTFLISEIFQFCKYFHCLYMLKQLLTSNTDLLRESAHCKHEARACDDISIVMYRLYPLLIVIISVLSPLHENVVT